MIKTRLLYLMLVMIQCATKPGSDLLIAVDSTAADCYHYFTISPRLEPNREYAFQLSAYLYNSLVGGFQCKLESDSMKILFKRESFINSVYLFYLDSSYLRLNHYDNSSRWIEGYDNLLRNCTDSIVVYNVVDSLLYYKNDSGFNSLWKANHIDKLHNFGRYIEWCISSGHIGGAIKAAVVLHNAKNFEQRDLLINRLKESQSFFPVEQKLLTLLNEHSFVSYELFLEEIYGGV